MPKRDNGFDKDPIRASEAGKKSKRPKSITNQLEAILEANAPELWLKQITDSGLSITDKAVKTVLAAKLISKALDGDMIAIREILDRIEGKSMQPTDNKTEHSGEVKFIAEWPEQK